MTDAIGPVGMYRNDKHLYWWNGDGPFTSVTTAMSTYDKSDALVGWAKKETSSFAIRNLDTLAEHREHLTWSDPDCEPCRINAERRQPVDQMEAARLWVSSISDYKRDTAADLGTRVHAVAEAIGKGEADTLDPELIPFGKQYRNFIGDHNPAFLAIEYMGLNTEYGYAGTGDIIARLPEWQGDAVAIDIKTWTKTDKPIPDTYYPETAMQLAACSRFDFIGREGDSTEYRMPHVDAHAVLLIGRDDYRLIPYAVTDVTFSAFLACLDLHRWKNGEAKTIVGKVA